MTPALLLLGACLQQCPEPGERFDPTSLGFQPSDGPIDNTVDPHDGDWFCSDGEYHWIPHEDGHLDMHCNLDWCAQAGEFCTRDEQWGHWWNDGGYKHGRALHGVGVVGTYGVECTPLTDDEADE